MLGRATSSATMAETMTNSAPVADEYGNQATSSLWIKYVPVNTNGFMIQEYFMRWGQVESVAPVGGARARSGRAIVNYYTVEDATRAYQSQNNRILFDGDHPCFIKFTPARDVARPRARPKLDAAAQAARDEWFGSSSQSTGTTTEDRTVASHDFVRPPPAAPRSMRRQVSPPPIRRSGESGASRIFESDTWRPNNEDRMQVDRVSDSWRPHDRYDPRTEQDADTSPPRHTADTYRPVDRGSDRAQATSPECKTGFRNKTWVKPAEALAKEGATAPKPTSYFQPPTSKSPTDSAKARAIEVAKRLALTFPAPIPASLAAQRLPSVSNDDTARMSPIPPSPEPFTPPESRADHQTGEVCLTSHTLSSSFLVPRLKNINDDTTSINSSSTHTSARKRACADCKDIETSISPFTKCADCTRRFHRTCGNPPPSATRTGNFRCGRCLRKEAPAVLLPTNISSQAQGEGTTVIPAQRQVNADIEIQDHRADAIDDTSMIDDPLPEPISAPTMVAARHKWQTSDPTNTFGVQGSQHAKEWPATEHGRLIAKPSGSVQGQAPREPTTSSDSPEKLPDGRSAPAATVRSENRNSEMVRVRTADRSDSGAASSGEPLSISSARTQIPLQPSLVMIDGAANASQLSTGRKHESNRHLSPKEIARRYKGLTCPFWRKGYCKFAADNCDYAHRSTGIDVPRNGNTAKHFTCFFWRNEEYCGDGPYCRFAHEDTGIYVTEHGGPSVKHVTCSFWSLSHCRKTATDCAFAHEDTGVYVDQSKESHLIKPRPSRHAAAPEQWFSRAMQTPQVDRDSRHSIFRATQPPSRSEALRSNAHDEDDTPEISNLRSVEAISELQRSSHDAALASNAESHSATEVTSAPAACEDEPPFETPSSSHAPADCQQTSSMADVPSQSGNLGSLEPASSNTDSIAAAKALYASFGISLKSPLDNRPKVRFSAPKVDTAASPIQQELRGQLIHGVDTPHSPSAESSISGATASYSSPRIVPNPATRHQHMGVANSTAMSPVVSDPEPKGPDDPVVDSAKFQTPSVQAAHDRSSNSAERHTAADMVTASAEPPRHFAKRSGRPLDPRKERIEKLKQQQLVRTTSGEPVADVKVLASTTSSVKTCETCSKRIFSGLLCKACQKTDIVTGLPLEQPSPIDEELSTNAMSIITDLATSDKPSLDTSSPKPAYTEHGHDHTEQTVKAVFEKPSGAISSLKRPAETSPFIKQKRPKIGPWPPRPVIRQNVDESPGATAARRALENFKEQEVLRKASQRAAAPQIPRLGANTPDGTDSNKENRQPSTVPSEGTSTEACSLRLAANHVRQASREGGVADTTQSAALDQNQVAAQAGAAVESTSTVTLARPQPPMVIQSASFVASTCQKCREWHRRCLHGHDGVVYDPTKCKTYLQSHPGATHISLAISMRAFQEVVRSAQTAGFSFSSPESDYEVEDDSETGEEYTPPPVTSNSAIESSTRCRNCRATHKGCFHTHDGTAYDPSKCKEYLEDHPNASCLTLAISGHTFRKIVKNAKMAGFSYSSLGGNQSRIKVLEDQVCELDNLLRSAEKQLEQQRQRTEEAEKAQDDEDDDDEEEEYPLPSPMLSASAQSDLDDSSDDDLPIYQSKKRKSQAEIATPMKVARFGNKKVVSMESSLQKPSVDPSRRDTYGAAKQPRGQESAAALSMPKPPQPAQCTSIKLQEAIAKLKARGVEFESDSDEDIAEDRSVMTREKLNPGPPGSSLDLFDIAPSLRPKQDDNKPTRTGLLSANEAGHVSKKEIWKTLLARQCRERKLKFGDPHQELQREVGSRTVATLIKRDAPEDQARAKVDRFHVPAKEEKVITTTFENFLGVPKEPVVCREWSGEGHKMWFELAYRDGSKGAAEAPFSRRNAGDGKYVFTKS